MLKRQLLIVFVLFWSQHSSCFLSSVLSVVKNARSAMQFLNALKSTRDNLASLIGEEDKNREILEKLTTIDSKVNDLKSYTRDKLNALKNLMNTLPDVIEITSTKDEIKKYILKVEDKWKLLLLYVREKYDAKELGSLAEDIMDNIRNNLSKFRNYITPLITISSSDNGFLMLLAKHGRETMDTRCNQGETYAHIMAHLFPMVIITEIKAYVLQSLAYELRLHKNKTMSGTLESLNADFQEQFSRYIREFADGFRAVSSQYLRACDPDRWEADVNFYQLEKFRQATVYRRHRSCIHWHVSCGAETVSHPSCYLEALSDHAECDEEGPKDCVSIHHPTRDTEVCTWDDGPYRIRFIYRNTFKTLGTDVVNECPAHNRHVDAALQWKGSEPGPFCFCQCASPKWRIVIALQRSRASLNYVVVGMQFRRWENFIYIQIAEGKLESNGYISDVHWVSPDFNMEGSSDSSPVLGHEAFFLGDAQLLPHHVLTGIKMSPVSINGVNGYSIDVRGNKFDYGTGKVNIWEESLIAPSNIYGNRELPYTARSSFFMNPREDHYPDSQGYTYITIRQSDLTADYGQSTVPFFDGVPVMTNPPAPMGGVGLFHKGYRDHAGFLSLRMYSIDYVSLIDSFLQNHDLNSLSP